MRESLAHSTSSYTIGQPCSSPAFSTRHKLILNDTHTPHIYIYIIIYVVCVCVQIIPSKIFIVGHNRIHDRESFFNMNVYYEGFPMNNAYTVCACMRVYMCVYIATNKTHSQECMMNFSLLKFRVVPSREIKLYNLEYIW